jgi:hypothetical protein
MDPHHFGKPNLNPHQSEKSKAAEAYNGPMEAGPRAMDAHPGAVEAHLGAVEAHIGDGEGL